MEFFQQSLKALPNVATSPMAFVAYITLVGLWFLLAWRTRRFKILLQRLKMVSEANRDEIIKAEMGMQRLSSDLTPEQWIRSKIHLYYFFGFTILCLTATIIFAIASWTSTYPARIVSDTSNPKMIKPIVGVDDNPKLNDINQESSRIKHDKMISPNNHQQGQKINDGTPIDSTSSTSLLPSVADNDIDLLRDFLRPILFEINKSDLSPAEADKLKGYAKAIISRNVMIEIRGHVAHGTSAMFNENLSETRARVVRDYLMQCGVPGEKMKWVGVGGYEPTGLGASYDNRVDFKVFLK